MARFARWFVVLGVIAALPAALLLGTGVGEVLRGPEEWAARLVEREALIIGLGVLSIFLFRTASGLHDERTWALHLGMGLAALLALCGLAALLLGGRIAGALYGAPQLVLGTIPLSLAALLLGARLLVGLWSISPYALPFGRRDLRALGGLAGVLTLAALSHVLLVGLAS
jgi:hypothetical protein